VAITVALRAASLTPDMFEAIFATLPWRDLPTETDKAMVQSRFAALDQDEAISIFQLWRAHSFRKRAVSEQREAMSA
jgi:phospholipid N-methyltransferase